MKKIGNIIIGVITIGIIGTGIAIICIMNQHQKDSDKKIAELENKIVSYQNVEQKNNNDEIDNVIGNNDNKNNSVNNNEDNKSIINIEMEKEELNKIEKFLNDIKVNGFVVQLYNSPEEIDLTDVLYNYNAMEGSIKVTDEIINEYKNKKNITDEELPTDIEAVSTSEAQRIFKQYTGISLTNQDVKNKLGWTYLENLDIHCFMHGDTNAAKVKCLSGKKENNELYKITLSFETGYYLGTDNEIKNTVLTLKKNGNSYYFVSNVKK